MNPWAIARLVLWVLCGTLVVAATARAYGSAREPASPAPPLPNITSPVASIAADSLSSLADRIVEGDIFRLSRRPASVVFGSSATNDSPAAKPPKPSLVLTGTIGGPPWLGILDGVPGHDRSVLVHARDTVAGLRVRSISANRIVIVGSDTTWRLTVRRAWP